MSRIEAATRANIEPEAEQQRSLEHEIAVLRLRVQELEERLEVIASMLREQGGRR